MKTRTQFRATCPICFRDHAVLSTKNARMVQHGYQRPQGWHQNVNECTGTNAPHFGTPEGRETAANNARFIRTWAEAQRRAAVEIAKNPPATVKVSGQYLVKERRHEEAEVDSSDYRYADRVEAMIRNLEGQAKLADSSAADIEKRVAEWKPVEPTAIEVETGPTLHAVNEYVAKKSGREVALCSSSFRSSGYKAVTKDRAAVSCKACLKALAAQDADAVELKAAQSLIAEMVVKYGPTTTTQFSEANDKAIKEIRYHRKEVDKNVRKRATDRLERGHA